MVNNCFHCNLDCSPTDIVFDQKHFCCEGCKTVYEILQNNELERFYELNKDAGVKPEDWNELSFQSLDSDIVFEQLVDFYDDNLAIITLKIPIIHCSSCVWVLESLHKIQPAISYSQVSFTSKKIQIHFKYNELSLSDLVKFLTKLGYTPQIDYHSKQETNSKNQFRETLIQLGIAGFAFGNIMLLALPEYLEKKDVWMITYQNLFRFLMFLLSLPVVFYSAKNYFISAFKSIRYKNITIDIPIALGILALFGRSCYEAYFDISNGYFDSLSGLVFFMLIGRYIQERTYKSLDFNRDFSSFYPLVVQKIVDNHPQEVLLKEVEVGDRLLIKNNEIIPLDVILMKGNSQLDNSFITGEADWIQKQVGDKLFAGGKHHGQNIEVEVIKKVDQSYLTQLWNKQQEQQSTPTLHTITNRISVYFVIIILIITLVSGVYWYYQDVSKMFQVITAILIVACPCALSLSVPFTLGNMMHFFGKSGLYLRSSSIIENLAQISQIIWDKTGTLSLSSISDIEYHGKELSSDELNCIAEIAHQSQHPLSKKLFHHLGVSTSSKENISDFEELIGQGLQAHCNGFLWKLGSETFVSLQKTSNNTRVYISKDNAVLGFFEFQHHYRKSLEQVSKQLNLPQTILSGDSERDKAQLEKILPQSTQYYFNQSPEDKWVYVKNENKLHKTLMFGDGLNDMLALQESTVGVAVTEKAHFFTPSSDAILLGTSFQHIPSYLQLSKKAMKLVYISFFISFCYNVVGLFFAIKGDLTPLVSAILMPISSISVVAFASISTRLISQKLNKHV